jgi:NAD+ kinase
MTAPRVVVVVKRTPYTRYVEEEKDPEVVRLLRRRDPSVARWVAAHREHVATLAEVERALKKLGARVWVLHGPRIVFDASDAALIVTVGGDGTLLAASHHVGETPILGVNSSPGSSVGFFCAGSRKTAAALLGRALSGKIEALRLARMQVSINGRVVSRRVLNEALFCHETPAAASRYILQHGRKKEEQLSSGFWVGTAAGSTGALHSAGGDVLPLASKSLELVVREPFAGGGVRYRLTKALVEPGRQITATSKMRDARLFLDGPFQHTAVRLGDQLAFSLSAEPIHVLGLTPRRGRVGSARRQ